MDIQTEPGSVILQYEPHPDDPDNERPKAYGYIQFRVDLGENALSSGRILRWTEIVGPYVRITVQSRSAAETPELDNAEWGPEMTAINVGDIRENEVNGVPIAGEGRWVDIRINLYTEDQNSPRKDSSGSIVGYGFTPYLAGAELIWREPTFLQGGDIPLSTGSSSRVSSLNAWTFFRPSPSSATNMAGNSEFDMMRHRDGFFSI